MTLFTTAEFRNTNTTSGAYQIPFMSDTSLPNIIRISNWFPSSCKFNRTPIERYHIPLKCLHSAIFDYIAHRKTVVEDFPRNSQPIDSCLVLEYSSQNKYSRSVSQTPNCAKYFSQLTKLSAYLTTTATLKTHTQNSHWGLRYEHFTGVLPFKRSRGLDLTVVLRLKSVLQRWFYKGILQSSWRVSFRIGVVKIYLVCRQWNISNMYRIISCKFFAFVDGKMLSA